MESKLLRLKKAFEKHVIRTNECWDWKGFIDGEGYGRLSCRRDVGAQSIHRASWILYFGEIPKGKVVLHICDTRICSNPQHLRLGTLAENSRDMVEKKRQAWGTRNANSKLTEEDIKFIRKLLEKGKSQSLIAELFDVHRDAIGNIKRGITWSHITC